MLVALMRNDLVQYYEHTKSDGGTHTGRAKILTEAVDDSGRGRDGKRTDKAVKDHES